MKKAAFTALEVLWSLCRRLQVPIRMKKRFSPLRRSWYKPTTRFSPPRRCCEACAGLFKCQKKWRKQFSPMWKSCDAGTSLFMCGKHRTTPFSSPRRCCEEGTGLFKCQKRWRKQFSPLWKFCEAGASLFVLEAPCNAVFTVEEGLWSSYKLVYLGKTS